MPLGNDHAAQAHWPPSSSLGPVTQEETHISAVLEGEQPLELSQWVAKPA